MIWQCGGCRKPREVTRKPTVTNPVAPITGNTTLGNVGPAKDRLNKLRTGLKVVPKRNK